MNRFLYFVPVIVLLMIGVVFFIGLRDDSNGEIPSTLIDNPMPDLPETALAGFETGDMSALLKDNPIVLVNYWASWCGPCRAEHASLVALKDRGIPIIGINYKDDPENASNFLSELGDPYAAIRTDTEGRFAIDWGVSGVPETFFINSDGYVVKRFFGPITSSTLASDVLPFIDENS